MLWTVWWSGPLVLVMAMILISDECVDITACNCSSVVECPYQCCLTSSHVLPHLQVLRAWFSFFLTHFLFLFWKLRNNQILPFFSHKSTGWLWSRKPQTLSQTELKYHINVSGTTFERRFLSVVSSSWQQCHLSQQEVDWTKILNVRHPSLISYLTNVLEALLISKRQKTSKCIVKTLK